jgi:hypothetical protein
VAAAFAYAAFAVLLLSYVAVIWNPGYYGDFGLALGDNALPADNNSWLVETIVPASPAARAGIKVGDKVEALKGFHDVMVLVGQMAPHPGDKVNLKISRGDDRRAVTLTARPMAPLTTTDSVFLALETVACFVFLVVGLVLVLLRPSRMTWAFYLGAYAVSAGLSPHEIMYPVSYLPTTWLQILHLVENIITPAGIVGFLVFCLRFPTNAPTGWRKLIDRFAPLLIVLLVSIAVAEDLGVQFLLPAEVTRHLWTAWLASITSISILACVALLATYFSTRGPEQYRIKWVVFGLLCTVIACIAIVLSWGGPLAGLPQLFVSGLGVLVVAFPLTVAYAVIRHRVIDVRIVMSRSLALFVVAAVVSLIVIGLDWLFSTRLPTSRFQTATYFAVALLLGLSLNSVRQRISKAIDAIFFRQWRRSQEQADAIADVLRRATSRAELYEPLTFGIRNAFSLTSVALFERAEDGGFVRVAASGWPSGSMWHILPDNPLIKRADDRLRVVDAEPLQWGASDLTSGLTRPTTMLPMVAGRRVLAVLLLGAHENGTALAHDELRLILRLIADACPVFAIGTAEMVVEPVRVGQHVT